MGEQELNLYRHFQWLQGEMYWSNTKNAQRMTKHL